MSTGGRVGLAYEMNNNKGMIGDLVGDDDVEDTPKTFEREEEEAYDFMWAQRATPHQP